MKYIYLLFTNFYYVLCFKYFRLNNNFRQHKTVLFSNNNKYNNIYLNKNNSRVLHTSSYLETLEKKNSNNNKVLKEISFDNIILYNNYIEAIYDNKNDFLIVEFKNNSRNVYYYINNYLQIDTIIQNLNIDYINLNHYPIYITNTPFAFFIFEKK